MPTKFVPMHHPATGGRTMAPESAVPHKQTRGWVLDDDDVAHTDHVHTDVPDTSPDEPDPAPEPTEQEPAEPANPEHEE